MSIYKCIHFERKIFDTVFVYILFLINTLLEPPVIEKMPVVREEVVEKKEVPIPEPEPIEPPPPARSPSPSEEVIEAEPLSYIEGVTKPFFHRNIKGTNHGGLLANIVFYKILSKCLYI